MTPTRPWRHVTFSRVHICTAIVHQDPYWVELPSSSRQLYCIPVTAIQNSLDDDEEPKHEESVPPEACSLSAMWNA